MPRAHYVDTLFGTSGTGMVSVLGGATISVYNQGTTNLLSQTLYTSDAGSGTLTNPFTSEADGTVEFWLATAARVDLVATKTGYATIRRTIDVEDVPGSGGGGGASVVYDQLCDGIVTALVLPTPAAGVVRREITVQIAADAMSDVDLELSLGGGTDLSALNAQVGAVLSGTLSAGSPIAHLQGLVIAFPLSSQPGGFFWHNNNFAGGDDPTHINWRTAIIDWTMTCVLASDNVTPHAYPTGTRVVVLDM